MPDSLKEYNSWVFVEQQRKADVVGVHNGKYNKKFKKTIYKNIKKLYNINASKKIFAKLIWSNKINRAYTYF